MEQTSLFLEGARNMADEAYENARTMQDDIEKTINAITLQTLTASNNNLKKTPSFRLKPKPFDNVSMTSKTCNKEKKTSKKKKKLASFIRKIKKKLHLKTKEKESETIKRNSLVEEVTQNSYHVQLKNLAEMMVDERELKINVILVDEDTNRNEILSFQCYMRDNISVKGLLNKIPQYACDPILCKKSYDCISLDNNFVLDDSELLQSYFLPSKENQFAIAVPVGRTSVESVKLALPVIQKAKSKAFKRESVTLSKKGRKYDTLPQLLHAAQCDSMQSTNTTDVMEESTEIHIPDFVYVVLALIFIYVMHGSSGENKCSCK